MKALVPHWKPVTPSPLPGEGGDSGEGGDPAFGPSGESLEGSEDGSCVSVVSCRCICQLPCLPDTLFAHAQDRNENAQSADPSEG